MGTVNKEGPSYRASAILRQLARETEDNAISIVIRLIDSRLQYFRNGEGGSMEGEATHLSWAWGVMTELRDLAYLGLIPAAVCSQVNDLIQEAVDHSLEVYRKYHE